MKVKLTKPASIRHEAGDIVEVSPARAEFLLAVKCAVPVVKEKKKK